eukprot:4830583-Alexandrium_andersonii.AAC.1
MQGKRHHLGFVTRNSQHRMPSKLWVARHVRPELLELFHTRADPSLEGSRVVMEEHAEHNVGQQNGLLGHGVQLLAELLHGQVDDTHLWNPYWLHQLSQQVAMGVVGVMPMRTQSSKCFQLG